MAIERFLPNQEPKTVEERSAALSAHKQALADIDSRKQVGSAVAAGISAVLGYALFQKGVNPEVIPTVAAGTYTAMELVDLVLQGFKRSAEIFRAKEKRLIPR